MTLTLAIQSDISCDSWPVPLAVLMTFSKLGVTQIKVLPQIFISLGYESSYNKSIDANNWKSHKNVEELKQRVVLKRTFLKIYFLTLLKRNYPFFPFWLMWENTGTSQVRWSVGWSSSYLHQGPGMYLGYHTTQCNTMSPIFPRNINYVQEHMNRSDSLLTLTLHYHLNKQYHNSEKQPPQPFSVK